MNNLKWHLVVKKTKTKNLVFSHAQDKNRELAKEQGFYDGRFKQRVIKNKKKSHKLKYKTYDND